MDIATIAATTTAFLVPYVKKMGEKFAETIGEEIPTGVGKVWRAIAQKFERQPSAKDAIKDFASKPDDEENQVIFRKALRKALEEDDQFSSELERLLSEANARIGKIINTGSGSVAMNLGVAAGEAGVAIQGDVFGDISTKGSRDEA